jgi:glutamate 5-kinase
MPFTSGSLSRQQPADVFPYAALGRQHVAPFISVSTCMQTCAQVLVTAESMSSDSQYSFARDTFEELLQYGAVPIVNENVRALGIQQFARLWHIF